MIILAWQREQSSRFHYQRSFRMFIWEIYRRYQIELTLALFLGIFASLISLAQPLVVSNFVRHVEMGKSTISDLSLFVSLIALGGFFLWGQNRISERISESLLYTVRKDLVNHTACLPIKEYSVFRSGEIITKLSSDAQLIKSFVAGGFFKLFGSVLLAFGSIAGMIWVDPVLFIVALAAISFLCIILTLPGIRLKKATSEVQEHLGITMHLFDQVLKNIRMIRAHNFTARQLADVLSELKLVKYYGYNAAGTTAIIAPLNTIGLQLMILVILGIGGIRVVSGNIDVAALLTFIMFLSFLLTPVGQAIGAYGEIMKASPAYYRLQKVFDRPLESSVEQMMKAPSSISGEHTDVHVKNISLQYREGTYALKSVNLNAKPGQITAIVGRSGAGKTSIFDTLVRFYDAEGDIPFDDVSISFMSREQVRARILYVEQDSPLLEASLQENLCLDTMRSKEQCLDVLEQLDLGHIARRIGDDFFEYKPGLLSLSGGERQRLAIARALLSERQIILLDEPTASLDPITEWKVNAAVKRLARTKTVIVIAHRISTVMSADNIYLIEDGVITHHGKHHELMSTSRIYRDMVEKQMISISKEGFSNDEFASK